MLNIHIPKNQIFIFRLSTVCFLLFAFCFLLLKCSSESSSSKFKLYYAHGEQLFKKNCANCHQSDGGGLKRLYPPLDSSDYMTNNYEAVICIMRYGMRGEVLVNGVQFNQPMPGMPALSDLEIAEIATYIYNSWEHERGIVEVKSVSLILESCVESR
ncbi:MAG: cytochrome c [Cyclobacteriaceae bacterium]